MIIKLTGPREGQTIELCNVQFVDGKAEVYELSNVLVRYYGVVVDDGMQNEEIKESKEEIEDLVKTIEDGIKEPPDEEGQEILKQVVAAKKAELEQKSEPTKYKSQDDFTNFFQFKAYVKEVSGVAPKNKQHAEEIMAGLK